jgi:hypothetical protein
MSAERILPIRGRTTGYSLSYPANRSLNDLKNQPINAVTFDIIDLSDNKPDRSSEYNWLIKMISEMPDKEVTRKMKSYNNSFTDIDDAVTEKVIFEAL